MRFLNGDSCPCCGQKIQGKSREWLRLFGRLCDALGLEPEPEFEPQDVDFPPPDAGLHPPIKPTK